jgi:chaperonin GroEL
VVGGGGSALLACAAALDGVSSATDDEAAGVRILAHALAEPMRAIVTNAGLEAPALVFEARQRGAGWTFDVLRREWLPTREAVADALTVVETALRTSVSAAATAITTEALVHRVRAPLTVGGP